ncbi:MAG: ADP-ribosylglycohydrolase family protein, partial [Myxococcota bacterium]
DAQLTTEIFGALTPGMPSLGLDIADLPIRTTASGYSAHAAQFHVALYSLAAIVDPADSRREQILWMVRAARQLIPDGSKTADVIDVVLADYLSNPDVTDWERTRDLVAERFQSSDEANGYRYLEWYESSVNLAGGLIALLYGEGDFRQTVQIGTLSGWDSDNGTATMGGLLGLMLGTQAIRDAFPGRSLSTSYDITRTRTGFPRAIWTFEELADRMMTLAGLAATEAGGGVESNGDLSVPELTDAALQARDANPLNVLHASSVNNQTRVRLDVANAERFTDIESSDFEVIADGLETDYSGRDRRINVRNILQFPFIPAEGLCTAMTSIPDATPTVTITWSTLYRLEGIRLIEGPKDANGGSFDAVEVQARVGNTWRPMTLTRPYSPSSTRAFEIHELRFDVPVEANGLRLSGQLSAGRYATVCEIDGIIAP